MMEELKTVEAYPRQTAFVRANKQKSRTTRRVVREPFVTNKYQKKGNYQ